MYKYGKPSIPYFFSSTRNSIYRSTDNVTAKIVPEDVFSILNQNALNPDSLDANDVRAGNLISDVGNITQLGTNSIIAKDSEFIKMLDPVLITNMKKFSDTEIQSFIASKNLNTTNSAFNIILNQEDVDYDHDILMFIGNSRIIGKTFNLEVDDLNIKDNIITVNSNNDKIVRGFNIINKLSDNNFYNYYLISFQNLTDYTNSNSLTLEIVDNIRYKKGSITDENGLTTSFYHSNLRLLEKKDDITENFEKFIHDSNNNNNDKFYLPLEIDRVIVHNKEGFIVNPNLNGNLSFKLYSNTTNSENFYHDLMKLSSKTGTVNFPHIQLNKPVSFSNKNATGNNGKIYFTNSLAFNTIEGTESDNYIFKIDSNSLFAKKKLDFSSENLGIEFKTNFKISSKDSTTVTDFLKFNTTSFNNIEASVDLKTSRIITEGLNIQNINKSAVLNIEKGFNFTGPQNFGIVQDIGANKTTTKYNFSTSKKIIKLSNGIIGKEKYLGTNTSVTNLFDPFPETTKNLSSLLDGIISNLELKYYIPPTSTLASKVDKIKASFLDNVNALTGLNIKERYLELIKKYFYIEPKEKKFINGIMIQKSSRVETAYASLENDILSDLTEDTQRITWIYTGTDPLYTVYNANEFNYFKAFNDLGTSTTDFTFYLQNIVSGIIEFNDIFETYWNGSENEFIFENSCSFEGFLSIRENISNNPKSAHFKFSGYFDRNKQKKNVETIYHPDTNWKIEINGEYTNNKIIVKVKHNSTHQVLVNCNLKVIII